MNNWNQFKPSGISCILIDDQTLYVYITFFETAAKAAFFSPSGCTNFWNPIGAKPIGIDILLPNTVVEGSIVPTSIQTLGFTKTSLKI